jgi:hypothetical protein
LLDFDGDFEVRGVCVAVADGGSRVAQEGGVSSGEAEGGRGGLEIRVRAAGVRVSGSCQVRLGVQEE